MTQKGRGKQKCGLTEPLPEGVDSSWEETKDRFVWELLQEYYLRPTGESLNPEMAFANINNYIKEDLHRSVSDLFYRDCDRRLMKLLMRQQPLRVQAAKAIADAKESRVYDQYLTHILKELRRSTGGETQNEVLMYTKSKRSLTAIQSRN